MSYVQNFCVESASVPYSYYVSWDYPYAIIKVDGSDCLTTAVEGTESPSTWSSNNCCARGYVTSVSFELWDSNTFDSDYRFVSCTFAPNSWAPGIHDCTGKGATLRVSFSKDYPPLSPPPPSLQSLQELHDVADTVAPGPPPPSGTPGTSR